MDTPFALGRNVNHDPASRGFPAPVAPSGAIGTVSHPIHGPILNQGQVGSCTGNAMVGALNTEPLYSPDRPALGEAEAVALYALATTLDAATGTYPPDDTGSDGLSVCKAAVQLGYLTTYTHAFGFDHYLGALMLGPVLLGIDWYEGFFNPDAGGVIAQSGALAGGHEVVVVGYDAEQHWSVVANSWGPSWGVDGYFKIPDLLMIRLLAAGGDVSVP